MKKTLLPIVTKLLQSREIFMTQGTRRSLTMSSLVEAVAQNLKNLGKRRKYGGD
jgi:hypothetical protein